MAKSLIDVVNELLKLPPNRRATITKNRNGLYTIKIQTGRDLPYLELKVVDSSFEYGILHVPRELTGFFPGYDNQFVLETDVKPFVMHLTAAPKGTRSGDDIGGYLCHPRPHQVEARFLKRNPDVNTREGSFKRFYEAHSEIKPGDNLKVHKISRQVYSLTA